jgi:predicted TIM-barrel fold metal-dependent hydrolase
MFAVDWPFQSDTEGRDFIDSAPRSDAAKARIFEGNARRLLRL